MSFVAGARCAECVAYLYRILQVVDGDARRVQFALDEPEVKARKEKDRKERYVRYGLGLIVTRETACELTSNAQAPTDREKAWHPTRRYRRRPATHRAAYLMSEKELAAASRLEPRPAMVLLADSCRRRKQEGAACQMA